MENPHYWFYLTNAAKDTKCAHWENHKLNAGHFKVIVQIFKKWCSMTRLWTS